MTIATQKTLWWAALFAGVGGTASFVVLWASGGPPRGFWFWCLWPPLMLAAVWGLLHCYRREPLKEIGFWHLRIEDLLAVSLCVGVLLSSMRAYLPGLFLSVGVPFSLLNGVGLVIGLLAAARRGIVARRQKFLFAFGFGTRLVGLTAAGAVVVVIFMDWIVFGEPWAWLSLLTKLGAPGDYFDLLWQLQLHRLTLWCLPVGVICCALSAPRVAPAKAATLQDVAAHR